ncbi:hypothetical protein KUW04_03260 [Halomonas denitrificans]|nr:hypothetical protein [Halomonas denitrificans]
MMVPDLFLLSCLAMASGIGADVALASAAAADLPRRARWLWLSGVTATHTLFPMAGYLLTFYFARHLPLLTPWLGLLAAGLIFHFYLSELRRPAESPDAPSRISWPLLLAISWDALWSGPAKSAQVLEWSPFWVALSFFLVGTLVWGFALVGMRLGRWLLHTPLCAGGCRYLQLVILSYFGGLALCRYSLQWPVPGLVILLVAASVTALALWPKTALQPLRER